MKKLLVFLMAALGHFMEVMKSQRGALTITSTVYKDNALDTIIDGTYSAPFFVTDQEALDWQSAKVFKRYGIETPGMRAYGRSAGALDGTGITQVDNYEDTYTVAFDRFVSMYLDKRDVQQTGGVVNPQITLEKFIRTQWNPTIDARFFSTVATDAIAAGNVIVYDTATYTPANVYTRWKEALASANGEAKLRRHIKSGRLVSFVSTTIMNLLEQSDEFDRKINVVTDPLMGDGVGINTRIAMIDRVTVIEVVDTERFYTGFDYAPATSTLSFEPATGSFAIDMLFATIGLTETVPVFEDVYVNEPGEIPGVNGYFINVYPTWDTFVYLNDIDGGVTDHIFVVRDDTAQL